MSTRSFIAKKVKGGVIGVYCHFDGYPTGVGTTLKEHYTDPDKVDQLIALGALSYLEPELGEKHDFNSPTKGWTLAYHRDRGEAFRSLSFKTVAGMKSGARSRCCAEYAYLFDPVKGKWTTYKL
jgi:hypothetical protein